MGVKETIEKNGEKIINYWGLNYLTSDGGRYYGYLYVTQKNLYFEAQFEVDLGRHDAVQPVDGGLCIPKTTIKDYKEERKYWIMKRVVVTLDDSSIHIFDRGIMSVAAIMDAISEK